MSKCKCHQACQDCQMEIVGNVYKQIWYKYLVSVRQNYFLKF